jgi:hypothetical protein
MRATIGPSILPFHCNAQDAHTVRRDGKAPLAGVSARKEDGLSMVTQNSDPRLKHRKSAMIANACYSRLKGLSLPDTPGNAMAFEEISRH